MRLIDADELLTHETTIHVEEVGYSHRSIDPYWVKTAPTIEAEPIVRCKDCEHQVKLWHEDRRMKEKGYYIYWCALADYSPLGLDNDYCSYGARKDEVEE